MGEARTVMDRLNDSITKDKDLKALAECYAEDAILHTPDRGEIKGRAGLVEWWRQMFEAIPENTYEPLFQHEAGDTAIDEGYWGGKNTGPLVTPTGEKLPATDKTVRIRSCDAAKVENGHIVDHRLYFDQLEFMTQLGLAPS
ncbi:MAG TPA: nuclear transport factor 2 family protein [Candidatus Limnocylindrales bacterium]|nr:nuclear transport factor 2 family protein [Candidatus Limnocylindrales bacterium]